MKSEQGIMGSGKAKRWIGNTSIMHMDDVRRRYIQLLLKICRMNPS